MHRSSGSGPQPAATNKSNNKPPQAHPSITYTHDNMVASGHGPNGCMETFPAVSVPLDLMPNSLRRRKKLNYKTMPKDVIEQSTLIA
jgi:hypothetical protein